MSDAKPQSASYSPVVLPLHEESLSVGKVERTTGRVRIATEPVERVETLRHVLHGEEVEVERVPRDVVVTAAPQVRQEGDVTVVPVVEEVLFVEKRLVLREEVRIRRKAVATAVEETIDLRSERLSIEREAVPPDANPHTREE